MTKQAQEIAPMDEIRLATKLGYLVRARDFVRAMKRHRRGDWGEVTDRQRRINNKAMRAEKGIIRAVYPAKDGFLILVDTDYDLSVTSVNAERVF